MPCARGPAQPKLAQRTFLALYNNYTMEERVLTDEDQEDVIRMVQKALGLKKYVRPKWYFAVRDPWVR